MLSFRDLICPLYFSKSYKRVYNKIDEYVKTKLSLDNIIKESNEFDRIKKYLFNSHEY